MPNKPVQDATIVASHIKVWAEAYPFGGGAVVKLPVSAVSARFAINSIPTATIGIPVGKNVSSEGVSAKPLKPQELSAQLPQFSRIDVLLQTAGEFAPGVEWPATVTRIWTGYITGTSLARTAESLVFVIQSTHWIIDLDASMALSSAFVSGSPIAGTLPGNKNQTGGTVYSPGDEFLQGVPEDLWQALKSKFISVATGKMSILQTQLSCLSDLAPGSALTNNLAAARLQPNATGAFDNSAHIDIGKLKFSGAIADIASMSMIGSIKRTLYNGSLSTSTMLEKLQELAQSFQFTIVPNVESATCAPFAPCLSSSKGAPPYHATIYSDEYSAFTPAETIRRVLRGVWLLGTYSGNTGAVKKDDMLDTAVQFLAGCYMPEKDASAPSWVKKASAFGAIQYMPVPNWIPGSRVMEVALRQANMHASMNTTSYDVTNPPPTPQESTANYAAVATMGDNYAKHLYWMRNYGVRTGQLQGKLRFDIGPGSVVRIEDLDGKTSATASEASYLYAAVVGVQYAIDIGGAATTSFALSHIRRGDEAQAGVTAHPLYDEKNRWVGTVLANIKMASSGKGRFVPTAGKHENA